MREVVLDVETTGLDPEAGHRVVEIGALELMHGVPTGRIFHHYVDPERDMPEDAFAVHGLSREFLAAHQPFAMIADALLAFLLDSPLVIHNAGFDMRFLNAELVRLGRPMLPFDRAVDTLAMAQLRYPGAPASLDALCKRFAIDASARTKHGALLDSELLAEVYVHLLGGRQTALGLEIRRTTVVGTAAANRPARPIRRFEPTAAELAAHAAFLDAMKDPIWRA